MRARPLALSLSAALVLVGGPAPAGAAPGPASAEAACPSGTTPESPFRDLEGNTHRRAIDCATWYGVAAGVSGERYDPAGVVRRDQVASFLARSLTALRVELPAGEDRFRDIDGNTHEESIERLAAAGVITGTTATTYDPAKGLSRAQLASLLLRTYAYAARLEAAQAEHDHYADDTGSRHEGSINRATELGLVGGYAPPTHDPRTGAPRGDGRYGPDDPVRRDQIASGLGRLIGVSLAVVPGGAGNPYVRGTEVSLRDGWKAEVVGSDSDAAEEVEAENADNEPPADGSRFVVVRFRATYTGSGDSSFGGDDRLRTRSSDGVVHSAADRPCGDIPDELADTSVRSGESVEGNLCFEVPAGDAVLPYDERWGRPTEPHLGLLDESGQEASPYSVHAGPAHPPAAAPATLTWFDEPPQFALRNGGALAIHSTEPDASMSSSVSSTELHFGAHLLPDDGTVAFQSVRMYARAPRIIAPGRYTIGEDLTLSLDNGTTCYAVSGEVVIHDLVTLGSTVLSAAVSIEASWTGAPSSTVCHAERVFAEVRWRSTMPVLAPEHPGATDVGRLPTGTPSPRQTWTIGNDGSIPLELGTVRATGPHAGDLTVLADGCTGRQVLPGDACTVAYTTSPGAPGERRTTLEVPDGSRRGLRSQLVLSHGG